MQIEKLLSAVFPSVTGARLLYNPPATVAEVIHALHTARAGGELAATSGRAAFYLRNAGCITERQTHRDGGKTRLLEITPDGELLLGYLERDECPHCGDTGEVPNSYTNEAGHRVDDPLPCPYCTPAPYEEPLPF